MRAGWLLCAALVSACDTGIKPTATISAADSADQVLEGMSHYMTNDGVLRAHVLADTARHGAAWWWCGPIAPRSAPR